MKKSDDPYRPCENPSCGAIDSTHCEFSTGETSGQVVPSQLPEALAAGCRVARFSDPVEPIKLETTTRRTDR